MTLPICETGGLLEAAGARLEDTKYATIPWNYVERTRIAAAALHRAAAVLRDGGESVIHPLGFARIPLSAWTLEQPRIAVHVWCGDWSDAYAHDIHDHCYNFVSICIAGEIRHSFFEPCDTAEAIAFDALHYRAGCCDESESAPGEGQRLALVDEQTVAAPEALLLHHSQLHRALPLTDFAITVQFQSSCIKPAARVFRAADIREHRKIRSMESLSRERLALMLESPGL
ncbi:hypothetical protein [Novosphingobium sp. MBES04]|uniref:hypothetical protein n=1 Tax=Novosphingobium sp. MBES04 TaxID=1206458 RepID=UPI001184DBA3|nr:hypothetical protein [Novosphingobium sp. MBES04]